MCRDMMIQENLTISDAVREGAKRLKQCGIENADYDSYALSMPLISDNRA